MSRVVVYGPQGCGKSTQAGSLMMRYGCQRVQEEWDGVSPIHAYTLVLTNLQPPYGVDVDLLVDFQNQAA